MHTLPLHETPPYYNTEQLYQPPKTALLDCYALALQANKQPGYPDQQQRLYLDHTPYNHRGLIAFNNTGPWVAGTLYPSRAEQLNEVVPIIGYPKLCKLDADYRPLHPWWRDMIQRPDIGGVVGKGFFYHWGVNHTADTAVIARDEQGTLHLLLIQRGDTGEWALPGGFLKQHESGKAAAVRETMEETHLVLDRANATADKLYAGPVLDIRTTLHAWTETSLWLFTTNFAGLPTVMGNDDAVQASWQPLDQLPNNLYGSHAVLIQMVLTRILETAAVPAGEQSHL